MYYFIKTAIDSAYYLEQNADIEKSGINPQVHYIENGQVEGRLAKSKLLTHNSIESHIAPLTDDFSLEIPFNYQIITLHPVPTIAVVCHLYYNDILEELKNYLQNIPYAFSLFITTDTIEKVSDIKTYFSSWNQGRVEVRVVENRGRDIAPKFLTWPEVYNKYEYFLHIHSKKSVHETVLSDWRKNLFDNLLGSEEIVKSVKNAFQSDQKPGIIAPQHFQKIRDIVGWGCDFEIAYAFAKKLGIPIALNDSLDFPSGSMFWARSAAIRPLLESGIKISDFPVECGQNDSTLQHAIERLYFFICEQAGFKWIKIMRNKNNSSSQRNIKVEGQTELQVLIDQLQKPLLNHRYN